MTLTALAPAKVNLCLFLGGVRAADGRHELVTVFESVSLCDRLWLDVAESDSVVCPGVKGPNLVTQALAALRAAGWSGPPATVTIEKRIPVAAGMGGGSADAAAALRLASAVSPVEAETLMGIAASLGADVAAQLSPGVSLGTGAGEIVTPVAPPAPHAYLILPSPAGLSTADVYREADRLGLPRDGQALSMLRPAVEGALAAGGRLPGWLVVNDLQPAAMSLAPEVERALDDALYAGADEAIVCGSGPTVAGVFWGPGAPARAAAGAAALAGGYAGAVPVEPVDGAVGAPALAAQSSLQR